VRLLQERAAACAQKKGAFRLVSSAVSQIFSWCLPRGREKIGGAVDEDVQAAEALGGLLERRLISARLQRSACRAMLFRPSFAISAAASSASDFETVVMDYYVGAFGGQAQGLGRGRCAWRRR